MERRRDIDGGRIIAQRKEIEEGPRRTRVVEMDSSSNSSSVVVREGCVGMAGVGESTLLVSAAPTLLVAALSLSISPVDRPRHNL